MGFIRKGDAVLPKQLTRVQTAANMRRDWKDAEESLPSVDEVRMKFARQRMGKKFEALVDGLRLNLREALSKAKFVSVGGAMPFCE